MTAQRLAQFLIEDAPKTDPKVRVLLNRALLQIHNSPSLEAFLADAAVVTNDDGSATLQLDFLRLPEEVMPQVERLLGAYAFRASGWKRYIKNGQAHVGLELSIRPEDIPGDRYSYAY